MLTHLEEDDVEALIETTFYIIGQYWSAFDQDSRDQSKSLLNLLLKDHRDVLERTVDKLPSLRHVGELSEVWQRLEALRTPLDNHNAFSLFIQRLSHENAGVVQQALLELSAYLREHQGYLQTSAISEQPDAVVTDLARALLDCTAKYNSINIEVSRLCAECIGLVGCLDSNRLETVREQREFVVLSNFEDADETTDFVAFLLEEVLVKSFVSTTDVNLQGFLSYVMQELLERCDYRTSVMVQGNHREMQADRIYKKWLSMPQSVREVLTPFLKSRYRLAPMPKTVTEWPILRPGRSYSNWLRQFTLTLLSKGHNLFAQILFEPLCRAIRVKDLSVAIFLLPYLVVHVTLAQQNDVVGIEVTQEEKNAVWNELILILQQDVPENASYLEREDKKLFCEVSCTSPDLDVKIC